MLAASSPRDTRPPWELDALLAEGSAGMWLLEPEAEEAAAGLLLACVFAGTERPFITGLVHCCTAGQA